MRKDSQTPQKNCKTDKSVSDAYSLNQINLARELESNAHETKLSTYVLLIEYICIDQPNK